MIVCDMWLCDGWVLLYLKDENTNILDKIVFDRIHLDKHVMFVLYYEISPNDMNN